MRPLVVTDTPAEPPLCEGAVIHYIARTPAGAWCRHLRPGADVETVNTVWPKWLQLWRELSEPDLELTAEEFAPVLAAFNRLSRAGVLFAPRLVRWMRFCESGALGGAEDSDADAADALLDLEDSDEDYEDCDREVEYEGPDDVSAEVGRTFPPIPREPAIRPAA